MFKFKHFILIGFLLFSFMPMFCYNMMEMGKDGTPITVIERATHGGLDKSNTIHASINGHTLTVVFTENLGQVAVEVTTALGGSVQTFNAPTPNGLQMYIPLAGDYIVTFTLPNRDEYYGEFTVTD